MKECLFMHVRFYNTSNMQEWLENFNVDELLSFIKEVSQYSKILGYDLLFDSYLYKMLYI